MSKFTPHSARSEVLAAVERALATAKDIAERVGCSPETAIQHLWAAEAEDEIEVVEYPGPTYLWRRKT